MNIPLVEGALIEAGILQMLRIADGEDMGAREVGIGTHVEIGMLRSVQHSADENDAHYIRTLPLHYTQKETEPGVFTLEMCVTKDFEIYMRRYENTTWEVEE